jgi:hypothetical protein
LCLRRRSRPRRSSATGWAGCGQARRGAEPHKGNSQGQALTQTTLADFAAGVVCYWSPR